MDKREILRMLAEDARLGKELDFQATTTVALRVQRALDNPDVSLGEVAKLVQAEPVLAARVVAVANSAAYATSGRALTDVRNAVSRLGLRTLRALVTAFMVRQLADGAARNPAHKRIAAQLWEHTAHVTSLAHLLARRVTKVDPEVVLFMGVVHEIGGFYLLARAKDYPDLFQGDPADWHEDDVLKLQTALDEAVLRALTMPEPVLTAMGEFWDGFLAMPPASLADTLLLANDLAPVPSSLQQPDIPGRDTEAAAKIEMIVGTETLTGVLQESADEVASLVKALQL